MNNNQIITLIVAGIGSGIVFAFQEAIKEGIKKVYSGLSSKQLTLVFFGLIGFTFALISITGFSFSGLAEETSTGDNQAEVVSKNQTVDYAALLKTGIETSEDLLNKKHVKDSIREANREKFWVYQIGIPRSSESEAWEAAQALDGIEHIYIFKESRKSYLIVWDNNYDRKMLEDSLENFKVSADSILMGNRVKVVDIMGLCPKRKKLKEIDKITKRKRPEIFKCVTCD